MIGRIVAAGESLYEARTPSSSIFFIQKGEVEEQNPGRESRIFRAPAVIGGFDALVGRSHIRTVVALTQVEALLLDREDWLDALEEQFEFARAIMVLLCDTPGTNHPRDAPERRSFGSRRRPARRLGASISSSVFSFWDR